MKQLFLLPWLLAGSVALAQEATSASPETDIVTEPVAVPLSAPEVAPVVVEPAAPEATPSPVPDAGTAPTPVPTPTPYAPPLQLEPGGRWLGDFNAGLTLSAGNTVGQTFNFGLDSTYTRAEDKLSLFANYLESRARSETDGVVTTSVTALQWRAGTRYDRDITEREFGFVGLEFSHDRVLELDLRTVASTGLGRHVYKDAELTWDIYGGLSWREDYYRGDGVEIDGAQRTHYTTTETLFGEESTHAFAGGTRFRQKFVIYPGVLQGQGTRATLDAGLLLDINKTLSLSVKLQGRYDSLAQAPAEKYDLYFITGLSVKIGN
jgi:putative salt-induced outer membrane protein YdiY